MMIFIAAGCGCLVFFVFYILAVKVILPQNEIKARVHGLQTASTRPVEEVKVADSKISFRERVFVPLQKYLKEKILQLTPPRIYAMLDRRLIYAGKQYVWSTDLLACIWVLSVVVSGVCGIYFGVDLFEMHIWQVAIFMLVLAFLGGALPLGFLDYIIAARRKKILRQLPQVLDLLCISVQAGLSFDGSMSHLVDKMKGPLIEECDKLLQDIRMGMPRRQALNNMVARCGLQEVQIFIASIIQSERLGVSIGKTLMIQAKNMRERRQQSIRAQALKAPVKMLFPLAIFIFPVIFVIILLPIGMSLLQSAGGLSK